MSGLDCLLCVVIEIVELIYWRDNALTYLCDNELSWSLQSKYCVFYYILFTCRITNRSM